MVLLLLRLTVHYALNYWNVALVLLGVHWQLTRAFTRTRLFVFWGLLDALELGDFSSVGSVLDAVALGRIRSAWVHWNLLWLLAMALLVRVHEPNSVDQHARVSIRWRARWFQRDWLTLDLGKSSADVVSKFHLALHGRFVHCVVAVVHYSALLVAD